MRMCLYEDRGVANLAPLAVARPAFDLLGGLGALEDGLVRHFLPDSLGYLVRKPLAPALQRREPASPVNDPRWLRAGPALLVNARWLPGQALAQLFAVKGFAAIIGFDDHERDALKTFVGGEALKAGLAFAAAPDNARRIEWARIQNAIFFVSAERAFHSVSGIGFPIPN